MAFDRPLLADGTSHPLLADGSFALLTTETIVLTPDPDPNPYRRSYHLDGRATYVVDHRVTYRVDHRRTYRSR